MKQFHSDLDVIRIFVRKDIPEDREAVEQLSPDPDASWSEIDVID